MRILYVTYDGLTDPIGQSQVLPYLLGCARNGHDFHVVSFEKLSASDRSFRAVGDQLAAAGIDWTPRRFHRFPPLISKAFDFWTMRRTARRIAARSDRPFDLVHARSYQAGWVALSIKRELGIPMLFDMRGFWADQRRDGGRWSDTSPIGSRLYRLWKRRERAMIAGADHVVVLSEAARNAVMRDPAHGGQPVSVIPCCADFDLFRLPDETERASAKRQFGFAADAPVLTYLGSIGTVYRFDAHLKLFDRIRRQDQRAKLLLVGTASANDVMRQAAELGIAIGADDLVCLRAPRAEVAAALAAGDVGTAFYTDSFYSCGVSPTKVGEYLACGLPVISNDAVGDVAALFHELDCGHSMPDFSDAELDRAAARFFELCTQDRVALRHRARTMFDLPLAIKAYSMIYASLTPLKLPQD